MRRHMELMSDKVEPTDLTSQVVTNLREEIKGLVREAAMGVFEDSTALDRMAKFFGVKNEIED
jgi:hypothetical protein